MLGKPLFDFIFEGDVEQKRADLQRRRTGVSEQLERRYREKDGAELWTKVSASPIFDDDGTFSGTLQMVSDMTDQKRALKPDARAHWRSAASSLCKQSDVLADGRRNHGLALLL